MPGEGPVHGGGDEETRDACTCGIAYRCPVHEAGERADAIPAMVTVECGACRGTGEIESSDSTDDRWWTCRCCEGSGKRTFADRRRAAHPEAGNEEGERPEGIAQARGRAVGIDRDALVTFLARRLDVPEHASAYVADDLIAYLSRAAHPEADRAPGEVETHPESYCHRCGGPNRSWSAPSPLWNAVMRGGSVSGQDVFDGIVCPTCFIALAGERGIASGWRLDASEVAVELELVTPSGREWDAERWMWVGGAGRPETQDR